MERADLFIYLFLSLFFIFFYFQFFIFLNFKYTFNCKNSLFSSFMFNKIKLVTNISLCKTNSEIF